MTTAHDHHGRWVREGFHVDSRRVVQRDPRLSAAGHLLARCVGRQRLACRLSERTHRASVGSQKQARALGAVRPLGCNVRRQRAIALPFKGAEDLIDDRKELRPVGDRVDQNIHGPAADESVVGGQILIQHELAHLWRTVLFKNQFRTGPNICLDATSAERPDRASVLTHQKFGSRLLWSRSLRVDNCRQDESLLVGEKPPALIENLFHASMLSETAWVFQMRRRYLIVSAARGGTRSKSRRLLCSLSLVGTVTMRAPSNFGGQFT